MAISKFDLLFALDHFELFENVTMSFTCDVIGDVIIMKIILIDDLHTIFRYLLSNWGYIENCEIFKTCHLDASPISYILSFWSKF